MPFPVVLALLAALLFPAATAAAEDGVHWLRLPVANPGDMPSRQVLALGLPDMQVLDAWLEGRDGRVRLAELRRDSPFAARPIAARMLALPIDLAAGERAEIVLRYRAHADTPVQPALMSPERFHETLAQEALVDGMILGLLGTLALLSALHHRATRRPAMLAFTALALAMMAFMAQFQGYLFAHAWPHSGAWNQMAPVILAVVVQATHALFTLSVFDMARAPGIHRAYVVYLGLFPMTLAIYLGTGWYWPGMATAMAYVPLSLAAGIHFARGGAAGAAYYLAGTLAYGLFSNVLFGLGVIGLDGGVSPFVYPRIGYVAEALFFTLALAHQTVALRRQVEEALHQRLAEARLLAHAEAEKNRALMAVQHGRMQLAATGHDLAQPLSSIRFALAALRRQDASAAAAGHIDRVLDYTESLLRGLIDDARRGQANQQWRFEAGDLLSAAWERHHAAAAAKGLDLRIYPARWPVAASEGVVARILDNLIGNAVRYCPSGGGILLGARRRPDGIELQVADTGPGFDARQRDRLLAPFSQSGALGQEREGHGLGLHIVKTLCEHSGYRLTVRSVPGRGSVFGVVLPAADQSGRDRQSLETQV